MSLSKAGAIKLVSILTKWSNALAREIEEHGAPNSFGVIEVSKEWMLNRRDGYRLGATRLPDLNALLIGQGATITYEHGRF